MAQIYDDGTYLDNNPTWHEEDSPWKAKWIKTIVEKNNLAPKRICEIGCGVGEILNLLSDSYSEKEFFGYEISPQAYEIARTKEKNNLSFKLQNLLENNQESFDLAMAIDVFEHVEDYFGF
ncbi:MAG TPA: class I SAM-dependent methyltransferase, partial [Leucothrix sp.]|nr:class I SAM-dependent methyltransferase [Leucothrix sp.]